MYGGFDYTATPTLNEPQPYGPCLVAVADEEAFETSWAKIIEDCGQSSMEIKGHDSGEEILRRAVRVIEESDAKVGLLLLDKRDLLHYKSSTLLSPSRLRLAMGCFLVESFLRVQPLFRLLCDEDFKGKREQQEFRSAVLRCNRIAQPQTKLKVGFRPSHKSALIQAADVVAYVGSRRVRGGTLSAALRHDYDNLLKRACVEEVIRKWG